MNESEQPVPDTLRVLLVDDDQVDRMAIERYAREAELPFEIEMANSTSDARQRLKTSSYDVVILDYLLGDGTGLELIPELDDTPSIIVTGSGNELVAAEALRIGAYDYLIKDSDGDYLRMLEATAENAIERSRTQKELRQAHEGLEQKAESLREQEELFQSVVQTAGSVIIFLSPDHRILGWNQEAERVCGWRREEVMGQDYFELFLPRAVRESFASDMQKVLEGEPTRGYESPIAARDGTERTLRWNITRTVDSQGQPNGVIACGQDITERHQLEEQLRQSQRMEAVGQLTAGIAHNFNNLLQAIIGSLDIALKDAPESVRRHLLDAEKTSERGAEIVRQLMLYTRTGGPAESKPVAIKRILDDTIDICRKTFDRRIHVSLSAPDSLPTVIGDSGQLQQVFLNVCLNARDALEGIVGRDPFIRVEVAPSADAKQHDNVSVRVVDNGCGISKEDQRLIFEPFFTTKEIGKGTGLGLSTAFGIVRQHRGSLTCASQVGIGTTFTVQLPAVGSGTERGPREAEVMVPTGTETILLIDDEEVIRSSATAYLSGLGYRVLLGADGRQGVEVYEQNADEVDLVLLDLSLPHMSGREVLQALRELGSDVKVIIFTGYPLYAQEFEETIPFLLKPVKALEMAHKIREVLDAG